MRTKVTLILVLLNVGLFFFIFEKRHDWDNPKPVSHLVLPPEAASIQSMAIAVQGGSVPISLELKGKEWDLTSPVKWPANPHAVDRILNELQLLEYEHTPFAVDALEKNGQFLADYGLKQPALTLTFTAGTAQPPATFALRLGTTTVDNKLYILSPDGTKVEVVGRSLVDTLRLGLDQLCSSSIFTIQLYEARELTLQTASAARIRLRRDGARWSFESPIVTRADKSATEIAIGGLTGLTVVRFLDARDAPADRTGLPATPVLRVNLLGNNRQETLLVGRAFNETPAPAGPSVPDLAAAAGTTLRFANLEGRDPTFLVEFPNALFAALDRAQETLRDHRVMDFEPTAVTALTLAAPGQPNLVLQRLEAPAGSPAAWQIARPGGAPPLAADHDYVQNLLARLAVLSASHFESDAPTPADLESEGFNRPEREVTLTLTAPPAATPPAAPTPANPTTSTQSLQIALGAGAQVFARVVREASSEPFIYSVPSDTLNDLPVAARVYRDRTVRELPVGAAITGLTLTAVDTQTPVYSHQLAAGETWDQALKGESADRQAALLAMLVGSGAKETPKPALLRRLRAARYVSDAFSDTALMDGQVRKWPYRLDLTISLTGGAPGAQATTSTLYLAERSGGSTQLAASPKGEANVVFELDPSLVAALFTLTHGAPYPGVPAAAPMPATFTGGTPK